MRYKQRLTQLKRQQAETAVELNALLSSGIFQGKPI
jgi:hypothetical protein